MLRLANSTLRVDLLDPAEPKAPKNRRVRILTLE